MKIETVEGLKPYKLVNGPKSMNNKLFILNKQAVRLINHDDNPTDPILKTEFIHMEEDFMTRICHTENNQTFVIIPKGWLLKYGTKNAECVLCHMFLPDTESEILGYLRGVFYSSPKNFFDIKKELCKIKFLSRNYNAGEKSAVKDYIDHYYPNSIYHKADLFLDKRAQNTERKNKVLGNLNTNIINVEDTKEWIKYNKTGGTEIANRVKK